MTGAGRQAAELRVRREVTHAAPGEQHFASVVDTAVYTRWVRVASPPTLLPEQVTESRCLTMRSWCPQ